MSNIFEGIIVSQENIQYQRESSLFEDLVEWISGEAMSGPMTVEALNKSSIIKTISDEVGLTVRFAFNPNTFANACNPVIDPNHPFHGKHIPLGEKGLGIKIIEFTKATALGIEVDFKKGRVGGFIKDIPMTIELNPQFFRMKQFTVHELAAILCHEIGHLVTMVAYLGTVVRDNYIISHAIQEMLKADLKQRQIILYKAAKDLDIRLNDVSELTKSDRGIIEGVQTVALSETRQKYIDQTGYDFYTERCAEQLADHFAIQYRAGRYLITAVDKISKLTSPTYRTTRGQHILIESAKVMAHAMTGFIPLGVYLLTAKKDPRRYDKPIQRLELMRQTLRSNLKDAKLNPKSALATEIMADLAFMDEVIGTAEDRMTFVDCIYSKLFSHGRRVLNNEQTQKAIEALVFNRLYESAMKFKQLGGSHEL